MFPLRQFLETLRPFAPKPSWLLVIATALTGILLNRYDVAPTWAIVPTIVVTTGTFILWQFLSNYKYGHGGAIALVCAWLVTAVLITFYLREAPLPYQVDHIVFRDPFPTTGVFDGLTWKDNQVAVHVDFHNPNNNADFSDVHLRISTDLGILAVKERSSVQGISIAPEGSMDSYVTMIENKTDKQVRGLYVAV